MTQQTKTISPEEYIDQMEEGIHADIAFIKSSYALIAVEMAREQERQKIFVPATEEDKQKEYVFSKKLIEDIRRESGVYSSDIESVLLALQKLTEHK